MNKAFVREPEQDSRGYCPRCGSLGAPVGSGPLNTHILVDARRKIGDAGWFCGFAGCEVAYFDQHDSIIRVSELQQPVYPKDQDATLCACFGFSHDDIEADARDDAPTRIRALYRRSQSPEARCATLAADGRCCLTEIQRLYFRLRGL